jgi:hypothetical protein
LKVQELRVKKRKKAVYAFVLSFTAALYGNSASANERRFVFCDATLRNGGYVVTDVFADSSADISGISNRWKVYLSDHAARGGIDFSGYDYSNCMPYEGEAVANEKRRESFAHYHDRLRYSTYEVGWAGGF